jgi:hypothetical protein
MCLGKDVTIAVTGCQYARHLAAPVIPAVSTVAEDADGQISGILVGFFPSLEGFP